MRAWRSVHGCDGEVSVPGEPRGTGDHYHLMGVAIAEGDTGRSHNTLLNAASHHQGARVSLVRREPAKT